MRREHGRNMIERILGGTTHQQIRTSNVALQFELLLLTVVCGTGEQAHDGSRAMKKQIIPSSCHSQACITNLLDATKMLQMMDVLCKKNIFVALAWNMYTVGVNTINHTTCVARELAQRNTR